MITKPTILLVDDDAGCIELWSRMLSGLNATLVYANSVEIALVQMQKIPPPDLVLLDLKIPPCTAVETLQAVHAFRQFNPNLAVIPISGMKLEEILTVVKSVGVSIQGVLSKDDTLSQGRLLDAVKAAMVHNTGYRDTMDTLETVSHAMEKKRTDQIRLPEQPR